MLGSSVARYNNGDFVAQGGLAGATQVHPCAVPTKAELKTKGSPTTQWLTFALRTLRYFDVQPGQTMAVGEHMPVLMRAQFGTLANGALDTSRYQFRGPIFHQTWGVLGEYADFIHLPEILFPGMDKPLHGACEGASTPLTAPNEGAVVPCEPISYARGLVNSLVLHDGVSYTVMAHANANGLAYLVIDPVSKVTVYRYFEEATSPLNDSKGVQGPANDLSANGGFAVAVICNAPTGLPQSSCDGSDFSITLSNLKMGWF